TAVGTIVASDIDVLQGLGRPDERDLLGGGERSVELALELGVDLAASAAPAGIGRPAPTIEFSPRKPCRGDEKYGDLPRPPHRLESLPSSSSKSWSRGRPRAIAHPWPR